jgi:beta-N-acetylhexosaminidase
MKFLLFLLLTTSLFGGIQDLTLEEKVGQILMVHFPGSEVNNEALRMVQDLHVGSIIYYKWANELRNPAQVRALSEGLQKHAKIPLLIAIDQEGGALTPLQEGFTQFPGNKAVVACGNLDWAKQVALFQGEELLSVGINLNLAPDVDVVSNKASAIGIRSFGSSPTEVTAYAQR